MACPKLGWSTYASPTIYKSQVVSNLFYPYLPLKQEENQPSSYSSFSGRDKSAWLTSTSLGFEPFAPDIIPLASI